MSLLPYQYVIKVSGAPGPCYYVEPGDDDTGKSLSTTSDIGQASRWSHFATARSELRRVVKRHPERQFLLDVDNTQAGERT